MSMNYGRDNKLGWDDLPEFIKDAMAALLKSNSAPNRYYAYEMLEKHFRPQCDDGSAASSNLLHLFIADEKVRTAMAEYNHVGLKLHAANRKARAAKLRSEGLLTDKDELLLKYFGGGDKAILEQLRHERWGE